MAPLTRKVIDASSRLFSNGSSVEAGGFKIEPSFQIKRAITAMQPMSKAM
jgi:hypothetical protein